MGLSKFFLKHGFGSPGSISKALTKDFLNWKEEYPNASKHELLEYTLTNRIKMHAMMGKKLISQKQKDEILQKIDGKLYKLILCIDYLENPNSHKSYREFPDLYKKAKDVMREVMLKLAPDIDED